MNFGWMDGRTDRQMDGSTNRWMATATKKKQTTVFPIFN